MATNSNFSKPSKWFYNNTFKLTLRRRSSKPSSPTPPMSPHSSTSRQADDFREAFHRFDANGDGKISSNELRSFFASAGEDMTLEEAERAIGDLDSDGDGLMDYGDFVRLMMERDGGGEEDLRKAFEMFEVDKGSGCITPEGLQRVLSRLGDVRSNEACAAMIRAYDLDGNGVLDYHEFHCMMTW
ncbi:probable calcium-binding protein CML41 [Elaeis guineensis]|uniref:Probable calcium-binding protein CML41 n=1 Tax=Elaeis guineensis var. tenera TaxID=51953 RepID=A0A6I9RHB5_ELAGV|nr:probable calcium-binding protein CML41 [Elaeis guineensis]